MLLGDPSPIIAYLILRLPIPPRSFMTRAACNSEIIMGQVMISYNFYGITKFQWPWRL